METAPKNKSSIRALQLPASLIEVLKEHKQRQKGVAQELFSEDLRICGGEIPLRDSSIDKQNRKYAEMAGLRRIRVHDFRHRNNMKTHLLNLKYINTYPPAQKLPDEFRYIW